MGIDLDGAVALITGGTKGVGRGIAARFAEAGARVVVCARNEPEAALICVARRVRLPSVDGRTARQQGVRPRPTAIVLQGAQDRIDAVQVAGGIARDGEPIGIPDQIIAAGTEDAGAIIADIRHDRVQRINCGALVGNPCTRVLYDPLKTTNLPGNLWILGAIIQGSDIRPPIGVEIQIQGKNVLATRTE